jgi:hypothetical protein
MTSQTVVSGDTFARRRDEVVAGAVLTNLASSNPVIQPTNNANWDAPR